MQRLNQRSVDFAQLTHAPLAPKILPRRAALSVRQTGTATTQGNSRPTAAQATGPRTTLASTQSLAAASLQSANYKVRKRRLTPSQKCVQCCPRDGRRPVSPVRRRTTVRQSNLASNDAAKSSAVRSPSTFQAKSIRRQRESPPTSGRFTRNGNPLTANESAHEGFSASSQESAATRLTTATSSLTMRAPTPTNKSARGWRRTERSAARDSNKQGDSAICTQVRAARSHSRSRSLKTG